METKTGLNLIIIFFPHYLHLDGRRMPWELARRCSTPGQEAWGNASPEHRTGGTGGQASAMAETFHPAQEGERGPVQ